MRVGGIILCGGKSTRMGVSKATLPFGPETMLERAVRLLGQVVQPIVVVAAGGQQLPHLANVLIAHDARKNRGPLEGLRAGLAALAGQVEAAYATSCDVPLLQAAFVQSMIQQLGQADVAVPVEDRFHHPLAAVYRTSVLPAIEQLLEADRLRPVFLFEAVRTRRVPVDELRRVDPQLSTLANLNRPDDYFRALREAGFEVPAELRAMLAPDDPPPESNERK